MHRRGGKARCAGGGARNFYLFALIDIAEQYR